MIRYTFPLKCYIPIEKGNAVTFKYGFFRRRVSGFVKEITDSVIEIEFLDRVHEPRVYDKKKILNLLRAA
ncbi:MAG TPA: hypothetical protein VI968_04460 [archaeon]|nr:hypothetical protein [archaeon]